MYFRHWVLLLGILIGSVTLVGCNGSDDASPNFVSSNLSDSEISALHEIAANASSQGKLRPGVPLFIPAGLSKLPETVDGSAEGSTLSFGETALTDTTLKAQSMDIAQGIGGGLSLIPPTIDFDGITANVQSDSYGETGFYGLNFIAEGRQFTVGIVWYTPDGAVSDQMKDQTVLVAKSVLADLKG